MGPAVRERTHRGNDFSAPLQLLARAIGFSDPLNGVARTFCSERALNLPLEK